MSHEEQELHVAYITQLRGDRQRIQRGLAAVERQWQRCRESREADLAELIGSLSGLRTDLDHHFAAEEAGGCVEEAVSHAPRLGRERSQLEREDPTLLALVDTLMGRLKKSPKTLTRVDQDYRRLVERIEAHEAAESRIIQESFGMDVD